MNLAVLMFQHISPAMAAAGFAVVLVLSLLAAEEVEARRGARASADHARL